jgi:UDP-N-acetylmuramoyl-tripeptide--D-alanyl-D-alanine ligase
MLTLADVMTALYGQQEVQGAWQPAGAIHMKRVVVDSRDATQGSLFVALRGQNRDGHQFIAQAFANGAAAVIAERPPAEAGCSVLALDGLVPGRAGITAPVCLVVPDSLGALQQLASRWRRQHPVRVVGITGSVGKTTVKELAAAVLGQRFRTLKSEGNYNNEIGLPLTLLRLEPPHRRVVLEMGMYGPGEIAKLAEIALPHVGVVTNVGPTHLERLGTIERIAQAKAELPQALPPASEGGVAILNADDDRVRAMSGLTRARVFSYGLKPEADLWADEIQSAGLEGIRFQLHFGREAVHCRLPMLGRHSVHTALSAAAVGLVEGLGWEEIVAGLADQSPQLRLVAVPGPCGATLVDDTYNSSPASCIAALNLLGELDGRKWAVLGDMYELGSYELEGHKLVGRRVRDVADVLVTVGGLGRVIGEEAIAAGMPPSAVHSVGTNAHASELLLTLLEPGDMVLIKGSRGMKMEELVADLTHAAPPARAQAKEA